MNYKSYCLSVLLFFLNLPLQSQRQRINLDENWKFQFGHAANAEKDFNYSIATIFSKSGGSACTPTDTRFADSMWQTLDIPHDWAVELPLSK